MATHTTLNSLFTAIANSIRTKTGGSGTIVADNFPTAISNIPTAKVESARSVTVSTNGTSTISPASGYDGIASVNLTVSVPQPTGSASTSNVLNGKTFASGGSLYTGTMSNWGAVAGTITSQGGTYTIPAGYHSGSGTVTATLTTYDGTVE